MAELGNRRGYDAASGGPAQGPHLRYGGRGAGPYDGPGDRVGPLRLGTGRRGACCGRGRTALGRGRGPQRRWCPEVFVLGVVGLDADQDVRPARRLDIPPGYGAGAGGR